MKSHVDKCFTEMKKQCDAYCQYSVRAGYFNIERAVDSA